MRIDLEKLKESDIEHKTPYFLFSKDKIKEQYKKVKNISDKIIYPVKTNPNKKIISILKSLGGCFLVSSLEELKKINAKDIFLVIVTMEKKEIKKALSLGVKNFIIDSEDKLLDLISVSNKKINIFLRFKSPLKINSMYKNKGDGFGERKIIKTYKKLKKFPIKIGLHNHLTSQNTDINYWKRNLEEVFSLLNKLKNNKIELDFLDLGGGIPVEYTKKSLSFGKIKNLLMAYFKKYRKIFPNLKIFLEPGRFIVGPSGVLVTKVMSMKNNIARVDSSVYTASMDTLIVNLELPCYTTSKDKIKKYYMIRGKSICSLDIFRKKVKLNKLKADDYIIFYNAGAYVFSSDFVDEKKLPFYFI